MGFPLGIPAREFRSHSIAKQDLYFKEDVDFFKNGTVDFNLRQKFKYHNSGYVLPGCIIELAFGITYEDFVKKYIFDKAGMQSHLCK